jgi:hypothetical protein
MFISKLYHVNVGEFPVDVLVSKPNGVDDEDAADNDISE